MKWNDLIVIPRTGGSVAFVNGDGVARPVELPPGLYPAAKLMRYKRPGEVLDAASLKVMSQVPVIEPMPGNGVTDTGANQSFRVSASERMARTLRQLMMRTEALKRHNDKASKLVRENAKARAAAPKLIENDTSQVPAS